MKKYNILEAVKAPVGTRFKIMNGYDITLVVEYRNGIKRLIFEDFEKGDFINLTDKTADFELEKILEPLSFIEMVKKVSNISSDKEISIGVEYGFDEKEFKRRKVYNGNLIQSIMEWLGGKTELKIQDIILNGKWYGEEE